MYHNRGGPGFNSRSGPILIKIDFFFAEIIMKHKKSSYNLFFWILWICLISSTCANFKVQPLWGIFSPRTHQQPQNVFNLCRLPHRACRKEKVNHISTNCVCERRRGKPLKSITKVPVCHPVAVAVKQNRSLGFFWYGQTSLPLVYLLFAVSLYS